MKRRIQMKKRTHMKKLSTNRAAGNHRESIVNRKAIAENYKLIQPHIRRTPVIEIDAADFGLSSAHKITFKLELFQHAGSFKARGAFTNLLTRKVPRAGVVAASGGNHGVAVAFAAMKLGKPAKIFVPSVASAEKMERIRGFGAELVIAGERYADALAASEKWVAESGAMPIHAFEQIETMIGQGSVGLEIEEQAPKLDTLLVAVGGGGLIGGVAAYYAGRVNVIGVEPEAAPTLWNALKAGRPVDSEAGGIAADSLAPKRVGELMFPIAQKYISNVMLVSDIEIQLAQETLWKTFRIVTEPGGAAASAALLSGRYKPKRGERVGILVCGGNTSAVNFVRPK
jgi:threonine dehydratase